jgi:hypothetical protein
VIARAILCLDYSEVTKFEVTATIFYLSTLQEDFTWVEPDKERIAARIEIGITRFAGDSSRCTRVLLLFCPHWEQHVGAYYRN